MIVKMDLNMKIIYNDRVIIPCVIPINCKQCVFDDDPICKAINFRKPKDFRMQVFNRGRCCGFRYEDSI